MKTNTKQKNPPLAFVLSVILIIGLYIWWDSSRVPESIHDISPSITEVDDSEKDFTLIYIKPVSNMGDTAFLFMGANDIEVILAGMVEYFPGKLKRDVVFALTDVLVDRYGNKSNANVLMVSFPAEEIKKVNFGGAIDGPGVLEFSNLVKAIHPAGQQILLAYCGSDYGNFSKGFCGIARRAQ